MITIMISPLPVHYISRPAGAYTLPLNKGVFHELAPLNLLKLTFKFGERWNRKLLQSWNQNKTGSLHHIFLYVCIVYSLHSKLFVVKMNMGTSLSWNVNSTNMFPDLSNYFVENKE